MIGTNNHKTAGSNLKKWEVILPFVLILSIFNHCTSLEEQYESNLTQDQVSADDLEALIRNLRSAVRNALLNPFTDVITLSEIPTDELIAPTRATDWDDNGAWRQLHQHTWTADHQYITACFNDLSGVVYAATDILRYNPSKEQEALVRFYRALAMYWQLDLFDQVPYRDEGESTLEPARVRKGKEAFDYIISELSVIDDDLPEGPATKPNKNALKVLLMKCYLNKAVYAHRESPSFEPSDMNKVIELADEIINSNKYQLPDNYFDNFAPDNDMNGSENIFTEENIPGVQLDPDANWVLFYTVTVLHYNSTPGGFNGWATLSDFYDLFEEDDKRKGQAYSYAGAPTNPGNRINLGFLEGQQYNLFDDSPLEDRKGNPLIYTREVSIIEPGKNYEVTGIRPQKYAFDWKSVIETQSANIGNDWVYFRLADVLLMKAEAILRGGAPTAAGPYGNNALEIVNYLRTHSSRGASQLAAIDLDILLDERGRELWLECWRRQDLIRFGKFLDPIQEKDYISHYRNLIFPIPNQQLGVNKKYLVQNPGY